MTDKTYTTHDIARLFDVYPSTVHNWIETGRLKESFLTPGGHYRFLKADLLAFLRAFNMPMPRALEQERRRVLIVDDDKEIARVISKAFARHKDLFETRVLHDGVEALISIGQDPPDLVVLDIVLPKMDGELVCEVLKKKEETSAVKIIAISGKRLPFSEKRMEELKVDAFFRKPFDYLELVEKSAQLLGLPLPQAAKK